MAPSRFHVYRDIRTKRRLHNWQQGNYTVKNFTEPCTRGSFAEGRHRRADGRKMPRARSINPHCPGPCQETEFGRAGCHRSAVLVRHSFRLRQSSARWRVDRVTENYPFVIRSGFLSAAARQGRMELSIVIPVYNEVEAPSLYVALVETLDRLNKSAETSSPMTGRPTGRVPASTIRHEGPAGPGVTCRDAARPPR
jgi:hypothetical protein